MKNLKFNLEDIKLLRSEVRDHPIVFSEAFEPGDILIEIESKFNYSDNYLQNFMHFKFEIEEKDQTIVLGHFDIIYTFEVDSLQEILIDDEAKKILHLNIISVAYSTSRGVLFSETKGFALNDIYLSPISPMKLYDSLLTEKAKEEDLSTTISNK
ncbi:MAG: hypothetical protein ACJATI_004148 [Halioglobus sp.]|jgi:hypothetical protein